VALSNADKLKLQQASIEITDADEVIFLEVSRIN